MPAKFVVIQLKEMAELLEGQLGFRRTPMPDTREVVFSKGYRLDYFDRVDNHERKVIGQIPIMLRVYSSITLGGQQREKGLDAIRVVVQMKYNEIIYAAEKFKRVHRVEHWRTNLMDRLEHWDEALDPRCPICDAPMMLRQPKKNTGKKFTPFYGCMRWTPDPKNSCRGTLSKEQ